MLPKENNARARIASDLKDQLAYCHNSLQESIQMIASPIHFQKGMHPLVFDMTLGLHVRIVRKYGQVLHLAELGQADGAEVLCRTMYESLLAQAFICRPRIRLRRTDKSVLNLHGKKLTKEFRALLYYAHDAIQNEKSLEHKEKLRGFKRIAKDIRKVANQPLSEIKTVLGPAWSKALRANTCAGVHVSDLAFSLGHQIYVWYRTLYGEHSSHVHTGDHRRFATRDAKGPYVRWQDDNDDVARALLYSTAILGLATSEYARLFDKTHKPYLEARLFESTYDELKEVFIHLYDQ
jgi:hypothetical protein